MQHGAYINIHLQNSNVSWSDILASDRPRYTLKSQVISCLVTERDEEYISSTYHSTSCSVARLHSRTTIPMSFRYRHQEWEFMTSSPQISLLEFRVLASPLPFSNLLPFLLPPVPPFNLSSIASPPGPFQDMDGVVFARMGRRVTVVSVHWRLHATTTRQNH